MSMVALKVGILEQRERDKMLNFRRKPAIFTSNSRCHERVSSWTYIDPVIRRFETKKHREKGHKNFVTSGFGENIHAH